MLANTYWNEEGKYQEENNRIEKLMPTMGMTDNKYLNLFMTACRLYYDYYNNDNCNLDCNWDYIEEYVKPFTEEINVRGAINFDVSEKTLKQYLRNESKLEKFVDRVIEFVKDKDLSYDKHTVYYKDKYVSHQQCEGYDTITFGNKQSMENWVNYRVTVFNCELI